MNTKRKKELFFNATFPPFGDMLKNAQILLLHAFDLITDWYYKF